MEESSPKNKLYGYGLCKGKPTPKIAEHRVQYLHFRYLKLLVNLSNENRGGPGVYRGSYHPVRGYDSVVIGIGDHATQLGVMIVMIGNVNCYGPPDHNENGGTFGMVPSKKNQPFIIHHIK